MKNMKKTIRATIPMICCLCVMFMVSTFALAEEQGAAAVSSLDSDLLGPGPSDIAATGDDKKIELPKADDYLHDYRDMYINAGKEHSVNIYRHPELSRNIRPLAYAYHGSKVVVLAEQAGVSCILYHAQTNEIHAGWVSSGNLTQNYPGRTAVLGEPADMGSRSIKDPDAIWSEADFMKTGQKFTVLTIPAEKVISFILDYQVTARNGAAMEDVLGPRDIYVHDGIEWKRIGRFAYSEAGPVHVTVFLEKPINVYAVATAAECAKPDAFYFRQSLLEVKVFKPVNCIFQNGFLKVTGEGNLFSEDISMVVPDKAIITEVEIVDGITGIGPEAFRDCSALTKVKIPDSVESIGEAAFLGCRALKAISIPDSVKTLGNRAFVDCSSLTDILLPPSITQIGYGTFARCSSLEEIVLPDGITNIGDQVFWRCSKLESVTIPDGVEIIGNYTLGEGTSLRSIYIPGSVIEVGEYFLCGFWLGAPLSDIYFGGSEVQWQTLNPFVSEDVTVHFGSEKAEKVDVICKVEGDTLTVTGNGNVYVSDTSAVLEDKSMIRKIVIKNGIKNIGQRAFMGFENLEEVSIPESVSGIYTWAFSGCKSLETLALPDSITMLGTSVFEDCISLNRIDFSRGIKEIGQGAFSNCESLKVVQLPSGLRKIGMFAFSSCSSLRSVYIPESVEQIDQSAFDIYSGILSDVYYGGTEEQWKSLNLIYTSDLNIHFNADRAAEIFVEFAVENGTIMISGNGKVLRKDLDRHISDKSLIESVIIESGITAIGEHAFGYGYDNLKEITVPETLISIGKFAISCDSLKSISLPEGVNRIGEHAFSCCFHLESIVLPQSLLTLDETAFSACFALKEIYYGGTESQWQALTTSGIDIPQYTRVHYEAAG